MGGVKPADLLRKDENRVLRWQRIKFVPTGNGTSASPNACFTGASRQLEHSFMSMGSTDKGLLTPQNCAVVFLDHQQQMLAALPDEQRKDLLERVLMLARAARIFNVPVMLSVIECKQFAGSLAPQILRLFPGTLPLKRTSMNAWDDARFVAAIKQSGRRNFLLAALWSEACLVFPALQMLEEGYGIYVVRDASSGTNPAAHEMALRRIEQAGGVSLTALQVLLEFQRDWARTDHYEEVMALIGAGCGMIGEKEGTGPT